MSTPSRLHQDGSSACSASMNAATPPFRWALATACSAIVVLPLDSGPNSSMIRPRGSPLPPSARSSESAPVEIPSTSMWRPLAQLHDRPGAERLLDLADRVVQRLLPRPTPPACTSVDPCRLATAIAPSGTSCLCTLEHYIASVFCRSSQGLRGFSVGQGRSGQRGVTGGPPARGSMRT